jgi:hypothetical protein
MQVIIIVIIDKVFITKQENNHCNPLFYSLQVTKSPRYYEMFKPVNEVCILSKVYNPVPRKTT